MAADWPLLLASCFALGVMHGVIPDEHTWPITFSYSVGSATGPGGIKSGAWFAAAFTLQRSIMSQLAFYVLASFLLKNSSLNGPVYLGVGVAMAIAGYLILKERIPHFHPLLRRFDEADLKRHEQEIQRSGTVPIHWATIHGFIAGFGVDTGLFTTFVYLIAVPAMPSAILGWAPGAAFGFGTFLVLLAIGFLFGGVLGVARRFGTHRIQEFGRLVGSRVLFFGGIAFAVAGAAYILGAAVFSPVDYGTVLVLVVLLLIAVPTMVYTWREVGRDSGPAAPSPPG